MIVEKRIRYWALGAAVALLAALVPAGLALGSHSGSPAAGGDASVILLTLGNQDKVTWDGNSQNISSKKNRCLSVSFASSPDLLVLTPIGGQLGFDNGFGVQSPGDGNGEPCIRTEADDNEAISVALGDDLDGYLMSAMDVDLELKFDAVVDVIFKHEGAVVATTTFDPMGGSDDGPDSKDGDNYRFFYRPMDGGAQLFFDEVVFDAVEGAFTLEGGSDLASNNDPEAFGQLDPSSKSSQFEVMSVFDGEITCSDEVTVSDPDYPDIEGAITMQAMEFDPDGPDELDWYIAGCLLKLYNDLVGEDIIGFFPVLEDTRGRYTMTLTAENQPIESDGNGQITSAVMQYNATGDLGALQPLLACEGQPVLSGGGFEAFWTQDDVGLLPDDETACYYGVSSTPTGVSGGDTVGTEVWDVFFEADPIFKVS